MCMYRCVCVAQLEWVEIMLSAIKARVSVGCTVFIDNLNVVYFSISTSYELLLCINRKFDLHPLL